MRKTKNLKLDLLEPADPVSAAPLNANAEALDAAVAANSAGEAELRQAVAAIAADLGEGGKNARICFGSYAGTGTYGAAHPSSLTFPFCPILVIVGCLEFVNTNAWPTIMFRGCNSAHGCGSTSYVNTITWHSNGVSWYATSNAGTQNNQSDKVYYYMAVGCDAS